MFENRKEAGKILGQKLEELNLKEPVVVAIPKGGVEVGVEIAKKLNAPLDLLFIGKLPAPDNPDVTIGHISENGMVFLNEMLIQQFNVTEEYIQETAIDKIQEIARLREKYKVEPIPLDMRDVVLVDDGIATETILYLAANTIVRDYPNKIVIASPVAVDDAEVEKILVSVSHKYLVLEKHSPFISISKWYEEYPELSDKDIKSLLKELPNV